MTSVCWWLVDRVSQMLDPDERDAVRGDLAESGESGGQALRGVLGLVVRRQAALWKDWQPWVVLVVLIVPLGMALSIASLLVADQSSTYLWLYLNNWDWALLRHAEFWYELRASVATVLMGCLPLVCWSWTAGFVLGSRSRRVVPVYGILFCLALLAGVLLGAPRYVAYWFENIHPPAQNDPISALAFYRKVLPLMVQALLVAVPSIWGMLRGASVGRFPQLVRTATGTAAFAALCLLVIQTPGFVFLLKAFWLQQIWQSWPGRLLQLTVYWPVVYVAACAVWQRRNIRRVA